MRPFDGQRILLGVTAGIASYKAAWLARLLTQHGADVDVVLTAAATQFVGAVTFEALTGRPAFTELVAAGHALDHIKLAKSANLVIVAPATADFLARAAGGHANDLLSAVLLATRAPVLMVPAMNDFMWDHSQVQRNCELLRSAGYELLQPDTGNLAAGEGAGPGRMPEPEAIVEHAARLLEKRGKLAGARIVVTAGPTREALDPVRFISNRSSGRMGVEIAAAAARRSASVVLVAGPLEVPVPSSVQVEKVETTMDMHDAVLRQIDTADVLVMAAAPADFTVAEPASNKIKKADAPPSVILSQTADILRATVSKRKDSAIVVGFALETGSAITEAQRKLRDKQLDIVVANDATEQGAGFGVDTNRVTLVSKDGSVNELPLMSKRDVAEAILDRIEALISGR